MLYAMGKGNDPNSKAGWDYINAFINNLDGKVVSSSSGVYKGVADGEYTVGLTYEDPAVTYVKNGAPVEVIFPREGAIFKDSAIALVKNCKHPNNAKLFIDYCTSAEVQDQLGTVLSNRPVREGATIASHLVPLKNIKTIREDIMWPVNNKTAVIEKYEDLFTSAQH
jgi:iron(III) transport system substrate-binding protein